MMAGHSSGQTLNDRLNAARYALAGQGLARVVCKATTEEMIAPKKKHIDYLLQCTHEPNVSIPQLANLLIERTSHSSWVVVFKSLVTTHHLMCYGNERFTQYLASSNSNFQLSNYLDKNAPKGYDMSIFIRRYSRYLNAKALSYRTVAFDFTKVKRGPEGQLRTMGLDKLFKTVPVVQGQLDALLEFDANPTDLTNGVISAAFFLLFKDLIRIFAAYNDGIIICLEKFFDITNKKQLREALDLYKKFLIRMNKVSEFLKVAERVGVDKMEIPDLAKAPSSLLDAMEQHLANIEGKKPGSTTVSSSTNGEPVKDETSVKKAIEEEEQFLNKLKEKHLQEKKVNNPFLGASSSSPVKSPEASSPSKGDGGAIIDLFGSSSGTTGKSEDLFSLEAGGAAASNNPFADILNSMSLSTPVQAPPSAASSGDPTNFATSDGFAAAFGTSSNSNIATRAAYQGFDAFGDVLQPQSASSSVLTPSGIGSSAPATSPTTSAAIPSSSTTTGQAGIIKGDLEASLANLAESLDINGLKGGNAFKKGQQFNPSPKSGIKTGGPAQNNSSGIPWTSSSVSPTPVMPSSWAGGPVMPTTAPLGLSGPVTWAPAASPIMPGLMGQPAAPAMMMPQATGPNMSPFVMRAPNMLPGAISTLPPGVTASALASVLAGKTNQVSSGGVSASTTTTNGNTDPFGAL